jgi:hypothetical protein
MGREPELFDRVIEEEGEAEVVVIQRVTVDVDVEVIVIVVVLGWEAGEEREDVLVHGEDVDREVDEEEIVAINPEVDEWAPPQLEGEEGEQKSAEFESGMPARRLS